MTTGRSYFLTVAIALTIIVFLSTSLGAAENKTVLYFFWTESCPYCQKEKPFLENLQKDYSFLEVVNKEVSSSDEKM